MSTEMAEQSVIGSILMDAERCKDVLALLSPVMFSSTELGEIYAILKKLYLDRRKIDIVTVLAQAGDGKKELLTACAELTPSISNVGAYAAIIVDAWRRREMQSQLLPLVMDTDGVGVTADGMVGELTKVLERQHLIMDAQPDRAAEDFAAVADSFVQDLQSESTTLQSGWRIFDRRGTFEPGNVVVIAADTGGGKTDLAINVAARMSLYHHVLYCTLEMSKKQLLRRIAARATKVPQSKMLLKKCSSAEISSIRNTLELLKRQTKLTFDDTSVITPEEIEGKILQYKPEAVFVDHLGLMRGSNAKAEETARLTEITGKLKGYAKKHNVVVVELVQFNRAKARRGGAPVLSDLKGSSTIEQDADVVIMLHREWKSDIAGDDGEEVELFFRKDRGYGVGEEKLYWQPQFSRYTEFDCTREDQSFQPVEDKRETVHQIEFA